MKMLLFLLAACFLVTPEMSRAADGSGIKGMQIEPASTRVLVVGKAHLSVEPLVRGDDGLHAPYKVDLSGLPTKGEEGRFTIRCSDADFDKLATGKALNFSGQAVSKDGNTSSVSGTATPSSGDGGTVKIKVDSKRGKLRFDSTYRLTR